MKRAPTPVSLHPPSSQPFCRESARILLADDEAALRRVLAAALRREGYSVVAVEDGCQLWDRASASLAARPPAGPAVDVIVSDIEMPGHSGLEVLQAIRRVDSAVPVVLISGLDDADIAARAYASGADAFLAKPFGLDELLGLVGSLAAYGKLGHPNVA